MSEGSRALVRRIATATALCAAAGLVASTVAVAAPAHKPAAPSGTLVWAITQNPDTLNQLDYTLSVDALPFTLMNDGLYQYNYQGKFVPDLATHYTVSKNGLTWTFWLRHGVRWSDGQPFTSKDVWWTWKEIGMPGVNITYTEGWNYIKSVATPNKYEVVFHMTQTYGAFMANVGSLSYYAGTAIQPYHIFGHMTATQINHSKYNDNPVVTGPFELQSWVPNSALTFVPNPYWWGPKPKLSKIVLLVVPSANTAILDLRTGQADIAGIPTQYLTQAKTWPGIKVLHTITPSYELVQLDEHKFLKSTLVRLAMTHLTPKEAIVNTFLKGDGAVAWGDQVPGGNYYDPHLPHIGYDPALAFKELEQAGFKKVKNASAPSGFWWEKGGQILSVPIWAISNTQPDDDIAQVIAKTWSQNGVQSVANTLATSILFGQGSPQFRMHQDTALLYGWGQGPFPDDILNWNSKYICYTPTSAGDNCGFYRNALMDKLTAEGELTMNQAKKVQIYDQIQKLEITTAPGIFVYWEDDDEGMSVHVHGVIETPNGFNSPTQWSFGP